jgi:Rrf2 family iron-sulfur cluster assembly transcriptional regulator
MKLTSKGRFAVMSLVDMAINSAENKPTSLSEISQRQNISIAFLEQIFSLLKKNKLLKVSEVHQEDIFLQKIPHLL